MSTSRSRLAVIGAALVMALVVAGCSSDSETTAPVDKGPGDVPTGPACGAVPADGPGSFAGMSSNTVGNAAAANPLLSTLTTALVEADLVDTLNGEGPFTVFAPANSAFGALPAADLDALLADKDQLTDVLTYHVVAGEMTAQELIDAGSVETVEGEDLIIVERGDSFTVDGASVLCGNVRTDNAIVYVIDQVMTPDSVVPPAGDGPVGPACSLLPEDAVAQLAEQPAATAASNVSLLSTLVAAVDAAELTETLDGPGPFTVFAPVDDAFGKIPAEALQGLLDDPEALGNILTYHVVDGRMSSQELIAAGEVETLQGSDVEITRDGQRFSVNGADLLCGPITTSNATIYLIDGVLTPPA